MSSSQSPLFKCCVCSKKSTLHPKLIFYRFPPEKNKYYEQWTQFCKVKNKHIKDLRVCSIHFGPEAQDSGFNFFPSLKPRSKLNERSCSVPFCLNTGYDVPMMHNFPADKSLHMQWLKKFRMSKITSQDFIACSQHFVEEDYKTIKTKAKDKCNQLNQNSIPTQKLPFQTHKTSINQQYKHLTDVCRPFTEILLDLQASGEEISEMEFNSALDEIANEVKLRVVRKARAEEFSDLCRVCLMHIQPTTAISDTLEDNITIADELEHLFELHKNSIRIGDDFPQKLCNFCLEKSSEELKKECLESMQIMQDNFDVDLLTLQDPEEESDSKSDILEESIHFEYDLLEFQFEPKSQSSTPRDCKTYLYALKCYICNLEFASDVERMQHFKIIHPPSKLANLSFESSMVRCRICKSTVSADAVPLNKHYRTHFETMNLLCSFCGKANFETASKYNLHLKKHKSDKYEIEFVKKLLQEESPIIHEPIIEIISDQISLGPPKEAAKKQISEKYLCELCGQKDFKYKKLYTLHLRQHNDKRRSENKVSKKFKS